MTHSTPTLSTVSTGFVVAVVGFFSSFPIVLRGLDGVGASPMEAASGLMFAAIAMGLCGISISLWTQQPVSIAWSTPGVALLAVTPPDQAGFAGAVAGFLVAGVLTTISGLWQPLARLVGSIPPVLAQAMLAGVLLPLCIVPFKGLADAPEVVVPVMLTWFICGRIHRLLAVPAAMVAAVVIILWQSGLNIEIDAPLVATPIVILPAFSVNAVLGIGLPLFIVTMATQNVPGIAVLKGCGYSPAPGPLMTSVGGFSIVSAPLGAPATCLAAITAMMCASDDSDPDPNRRYWSAVIAGGFYCVFGVFAGAITAFAALGPPVLLGTLAGIALLGVLTNSASAALADPADREAAALTLVTTASGVTIFGLGGAVWGLIIGGIAYVAARKIKH